MSEVYYDIEVAPNRCIVGFLTDGSFRYFDVKERSLTESELAEIDEICTDATLIGYNNAGFDTYLLYYLTERDASAKDVFALTDAIINNGPAWSAAKRMNAKPSKYVELDLMHFSKKAKLKVYECRMGMDRVETLPFKPGENIEDDALPRVLSYLKHDLDATALLHSKVKDEIDIRRALCDLFDLPGLMSKGPAGAAEAVILSEYLRADPDTDMDTIRSAARRAHYCFMEFRAEDWVHRTVKGTVAEEILNQIDGTVFPIIDGNRGKPDREWPSRLNLDGTDAAFGVGGLHSVDAAGRASGNLWDFDVASYYPRLLLAPGGAPEHLSKKLFREIYGGILERRLEAKHAGRKREANALKLVLNSVFGKLGDKWSPLFSPASFLHVTIGGQLSLIALGERLTSKKGTLL
jgi:hypothetical protein